MDIYKVNGKLNVKIYNAKYKKELIFIKYSAKISI